MSGRLALASIWLPPWMIRRELGRVEAATLSALDRLLVPVPAPGTPEARGGLVAEDAPTAARRTAMAGAHDVRVARLIDARGREAAIREARAALYAEGVRLGSEARDRLRVQQTRRDLLRAARVLYRVLGIHFRAEWPTPGEARVEITHCALAAAYSPDTCLALSATDAGVVAGLWPGARLEFEHRMTEGRATCIARLTLPSAQSKDAE